MSVTSSYEVKQPLYSGTAVTAFGDSITFGTAASTPALAWPGLVSSAAGWALTNLAVATKEIPDIAADQVYATQVVDGGNYMGLYGLNDYDNAGGSLNANLTSYMNALRAALIWQAIPETKKILGNNVAITYGSGWSNNTTYGRATGKKTTTNGTTATVTLYGTAIYIGFAIDTATPGGVFSVTVDGVDYGAVDTSVGLVPAVSGKTLWPNVRRIGGLINGQHTVVVTIVGAGKPVYLDFFASNEKSTYLAAPRVWVGNSLRHGESLYPNPPLATDTIVTEYNIVSQRICGELAADGLEVAYVDASNQFNPDITAERGAGDPVHPSDIGHANIAKAFLAVINQTVAPLDRNAILYAARIGSMLSYDPVNARLTIADQISGYGAVNTTPPKGISKVDIVGSVANSSSAAIQMLTTADPWPMFQLLAYQHNTVYWGFDMFYTGSAWISSYNATNYVMGKSGGFFEWYYAPAAAAGSVLAPTMVMRLSSADLLLAGYLNVGSSTAPPPHTTAGDQTAIRVFATSAVFSGAGTALTVSNNATIGNTLTVVSGAVFALSGVATASIFDNGGGTTLIALQVASPQLTFAGDIALSTAGAKILASDNSTQMTVAAAGVTFASAITATGGIASGAAAANVLAHIYDVVFGTERITLTSASPHIKFTGNSTLTGYLRVGSASAPTNTTAGDLTFTRGYGDSAVIGSSPTGGNEGTGTINVATGYYVNGTLVGTLANPAATIGLAAVNGSATTGMRSDGAPALSQAIAPTWTALHLFSQAGIAVTETDAARLINSTLSTAGVPVQQSPALRFTGHAWNTTGGGSDTFADARIYLIPVSGTTASATLSFRFRTNNSADSNLTETEQMSLTSGGVLTVATIAGNVNFTGNVPTFANGLSLTAGSIFDSGPTARITLATASPHIQLTGNLKMVTASATILASDASLQITIAAAGVTFANTIVVTSGGITATTGTGYFGNVISPDIYDVVFGTARVHLQTTTPHLTFTGNILLTGYIDWPNISSPANPASGNIRQFSSAKVTGAYQDAPRWLDSGGHDSAPTMRARNAIPKPLDPVSTVLTNVIPSATLGIVGMVELMEPLLLHQIDYNIGTIGAGISGVLRIAIYTESGVLITGTNTTDSSSLLATGVKTLVLSADVYLLPGVYCQFFCMATAETVTNPAISCFTSEGTFRAVTGESILCGTVVCVGGAAPSPLGTITSVANRVPYFKWYGAAT